MQGRRRVRRPPDDGAQRGAHEWQLAWSGPGNSVLHRNRLVCDPLIVTVVSGGSLIGRERELQLVGDLLGAVSGGSAVVVLIEGEAGIGKTRLLASVSDLAVARGMAVFRGAAHPLERTRPFGRWSTRLN
jgi:hypothetical protein